MEWNDEGDPTKGFQYLYLTDADHSRLTAAAGKPTFKVRTHYCLVVWPINWGSGRMLGHEQSSGLARQHGPARASPAVVASLASRRTLHGNDLPGGSLQA